MKRYQNPILLFCNKLCQSSFSKSVAILASGAALAWIIPVLASPILTRLYTPTDFGTFAVFMALVSSVIPAVCGKYEVAMVLPKSNIQGLHLLGISFRVAITISLIFLLIVLVFKNYLLTVLNARQLGEWIYLAPLALVSTGLMTAMNYFANRNKDYKNMAKGKIVNASFVAFTSIILGFFGLGFRGLLTGAITGLIAATIYFLFLYRKILSSDLLLWGKAKVELMKRYIDFPVYNASGGLLNGITVALPVFFLSHYFSESIVGYFSLVLRVANLPLSFISASVSEVNLKKIVDLVNMKTDVRPYLIKITIGLTAVVLLPTTILMIFSPSMFSFVFGEKWREAGVYMQILMPAMAVRFVSSTLSTTLGATQNNQLGAIWKITDFVVTVIVFSIFAPHRDIKSLLKVFVLMDIALYLFYYLLIWKAAANPRNRIS